MGDFVHEVGSEVMEILREGDVEFSYLQLSFKITWCRCCVTRRLVYILLRVLYCLENAVVFFEEQDKLMHTSNC